jgi:hypothetical protein
VIYLIVALSVAIGVTLLLSLSPFARSNSWHATAPPLASIIGSGFLVSGPLLAREFGGLAIVAMAALLVVAEVDALHPIAWLARSGQFILALAYAVSVAYYLRLLAEFALRYANDAHPLLAPPAVTLLISALVLLALSGGVLLGLLVTVQGFELSRYLGQSYAGNLRILTMRRAQGSVNSALQLPIPTDRPDS